MKKRAICHGKRVKVNAADAVHMQCIEHADTVSVTLRRERRRNAPWIIAVWGDDDIGLEIEVQDQDRARRVYDKVTVDGMTVAELIALGFEQW